MYIYWEPSRSLISHWCHEITVNHCLKKKKKKSAGINFTFLACCQEPKNDFRVQKAFIHLTHQKSPNSLSQVGFFIWTRELKHNVNDYFPISQWRTRTLADASERNWSIIYNGCPRALMLNSLADPKCGQMLQPPLSTHLLLVSSQF